MTARTGAARLVRMLVLAGLVMVAVVAGLFGPALVEDLSTRGSKLAATKRRFERLLAYAQWRDKRTKALVRTLDAPPKPARPH
jgi:NADP-dependent 3-hydroxy acid dehydrogenase YdfG